MKGCVYLDNQDNTTDFQFVESDILSNIFKSKFSIIVLVPDFTMGKLSTLREI